VGAGLLFGNGPIVKQDFSLVTIGIVGRLAVADGESVRDG
jgi:hypothetical protein